MNRLQFLKRSLTGLGVIAGASAISTAASNSKTQYSFDELFITHTENDRLVYPRKDAPFYNQVLEGVQVENRPGCVAVKLPERSIFLPVQDFYTSDMFLPIKYYFEDFSGRLINSVDYDGVCFRFIKTKGDRMHLESFFTDF